jgi:hypothetical protein
MVSFKPGHFISRVRVPHTLWVEGWMNPSASLDMVGNKKSLSNLSSSVALPVA